MIAISRNHRSNLPIYDFLFVAITLAFLSISFILNYTLKQDIDQKTSKEFQNKKTYLTLIYIIFIIQAILFFLELISLIISYILD